MDISFLAQLLRYYQTIKHLRFKQVYFRLYYRILPPGAPKVSGTAERRKALYWNAPTWAKPSLLSKTEVEFLGQRSELRSPADWNDQSKDLLWLFNLHYFDDLSSSGKEEKRSLQRDWVERWIEENPVAQGVGWHPYTVSLRVVNFVKWCLQEPETSGKVCNSIEQQARFLLKRLEYNILANHLFANGKALIFAGIFLDGNSGKRLYRKGLSILDEEINEQFLADGGHYERSPMYHSILLWDLLELIKLAQVSKISELVERETKWRAFASRALEWLKVMLHPDGDISFFNDSALSIAPNPKDIFRFASELHLLDSPTEFPQLSVLPESGYSRLGWATNTVLFDHGDVGPDYQPGHAHADTLSLEWSVGTQRLIVNSGTSVYRKGSLRQWQRQTAAHSTVTVAGLDSSEVWGGFRVGRRALAQLELIKWGRNKLRISASHNGYSEGRPNSYHRRDIYSDKHGLRVEDTLEVEGPNAVAYFYLHPNVTIQPIAAQELMLTVSDRWKVRVTADAEIIVENANWYPSFGVAMPNFRLSTALVGGKSVVCFTIVDETEFKTAAT